MQKDLSGSVWYSKVDYDAIAADLADEKHKSEALEAENTDHWEWRRRMGAEAEADHAKISQFEAALRGIATNTLKQGSTDERRNEGIRIGLAMAANMATRALDSELETSVEREECPQCGGQGHIKVYADGVFQKAIDCGMCSAPNRAGVKDA